MLKPLEIEFREAPPSAGLSAAIRRRVTRLQEHFQPLLGCRVIVGMPRASSYTACVSLSLDGREIQAMDGARNDGLSAVLGAFDAVQRELEECARNGEVRRLARFDIAAA